MKSTDIPIKTIERLSLYRRILRELLEKGEEYIFSYRLAVLADKKASQVRRDFMVLNQFASPQKGYAVRELIECISGLLDSGEKLKMAIVGIGNMGRAFINYFKGRGKNLEITAGFDNDDRKNNRVINGCRIYPVEKMKEILRKEKIRIGIITVPEDRAQNIAEELIQSGIKAIVNVAPVPIKSPADVHIENLDLTSVFEKTAYFAKISTDSPEKDGGVEHGRDI
ncbi:MAG: redox-sensing transcriptional repressor Rex [Spirochaetales bacterium]|nr:redox-sensing transcriptional repressor Rex [Spirochaetales bacterium]